MNDIANENKDVSVIENMSVDEFAKLSDSEKVNAWNFISKEASETKDNKRLLVFHAKFKKQLLEAMINVTKNQESHSVICGDT